MEFKTVNINGAKVHLKETSNYKMGMINFSFNSKINKKEVTIKLLLLQVLLESTKKYNTYRKLKIASKELYSCFDNSFVQKRRGISRFNVGFRFLGNKYTDGNIYLNILDYINEILFNPDLDEGKFKDSVFNHVKRELKDFVLKDNDNPNHVAIRDSLKMLNEDSSVYFDRANLEEIDKITKEELLKFYKNLISTNSLDIFIIGDFESLRVSNKIKKIFKNRNFKEAKVIPTYIDFKKNKLIEKKVYKDAAQSKLVMIYNVDKLTEYERDYVAHVYSKILGSGMNSKLFKNVREKESLCYEISSGFYYSLGVLCIFTGIDEKNYDKTKTIIAHTVESMKEEISKEEFLNAKNFLIKSEESSNDEIWNSLSKMESMILFEEEDSEFIISKIKSVTMEDLLRFHSKLNLQCCYLQSRGKNDKKRI